MLYTENDTDNTHRKFPTKTPREIPEHWGTIRRENQEEHGKTLLHMFSHLFFNADEDTIDEVEADDGTALRSANVARRRIIIPCLFLREGVLLYYAYPRTGL